MIFNVQEEFMRLSTSVTEAEVDRAKAILTAYTLLQLDTSTAVCEDVGKISCANFNFYIRFILYCNF